MQNVITTTQIQGLEASVLLDKIDQLQAQLTSLQDTIKPTQEIELLTRKEVSKMLSVSLVTLHRWNKKGLLVPHRLGNEIRYKKHEVLGTLTTIAPEQQN